MQRLNILYEADVIDQQTRDLMRKVISYLQEVHRLEETKMEVFITHLAMAIMRMKKGEAVDDMESVILADIEKNKYHGQALQIVAEIETWSGFNYARSEISYLLLHLVNLLSERGEG